MDISTLKHYAAEGLTRNEIAEKTGLSYSRITTILREHNIPVKRKKAEIKRPPKYDNDAIIALRKDGHSYGEIAKQLNMPKHTVAGICQDAELGGSSVDQAHSEEEIQRIIDLAGYVYIGGYTSKDHKVTAKCKVCGAVIDRYWHVFRDIASGKYEHNSKCPGCRQLEEEKKREEQQAIKQAEHEAQEQERLQRKQVKDSRRISEELMQRLAIRVCKACGREYVIELTGYNSRLYCSETCQHRKYWDRHEKARARRMYSRMHDNDITLKKLYARDDGKCYICGRQCDWNDRQANKGNITVGPTYPTMDHVRPLAKGGTHTWDNVRLACKKCNEVKGIAQYSPHMSKK